LAIIWLLVGCAGLWTANFSVNAVSPGPISTPLYEKLGFSEAELKNVAASIQGQVPAKRFGKASEIASAVVFFASDESAFTVGSELLIDGGMSNL
jgi:NAD(P)-dependent dehydrogenase (short-subunit alcohol dehydrogenase family)